MRIHCQYARLSELANVGAQVAEGWLSLDERRDADQMRCDKRRLTWTSGRVLAKNMLLRMLNDKHLCEIRPTEIHIETRSTRPGHSDRPSVYVTGRKFDCALSIAHTSRGVLAALGKDTAFRVGVDLVCRGDGLPRGLQWCLSPRERQWLAGGPANKRCGEQIWALKEAIYKAAQRGEGFAPGRIEAVPDRDPSYPGLDPAAVRRLESWRVDGQFAALAVVERTADVQGAVESQPLQSPAINNSMTHLPIVIDS